MVVEKETVDSRKYGKRDVREGIRPGGVSTVSLETFLFRLV